MKYFNLAFLTIALAMFSMIANPALVSAGQQNGPEVLDFSSLETLVFDIPGTLKDPAISDVKQTKYRHVVEARLASNPKWKINLSMSVNKKFVFIVFNCQKLDPNADNGPFLKRVLERNRSLGLMRFEVSDALLRLVLPISNQDLTKSKINGLIHSVAQEAKRTLDLWGSPPKSTLVRKPESPAPAVQEPSGAVGGLMGAFGNSGGEPPVRQTPPPGLNQTQLEASMICDTNGSSMRMGTLSIGNGEFFGLINFGPDGSFALNVSKDAGANSFQDNGTWSIENGKLQLALESGQKKYFDLVTTNDEEIKLVSISKEDTITIKN